LAASFRVHRFLRNGRIRWTDVGRRASPHCYEAQPRVWAENAERAESARWRGRRRVTSDLIDRLYGWTVVVALAVLFAVFGSGGDVDDTETVFVI